MKGINILDKMISQVPVNMTGRLVLFISWDIYKDACDDLNRKLRNYKGFKVYYKKLPVFKDSGMIVTMAHYKSMTVLPIKLKKLMKE